MWTTDVDNHPQFAILHRAAEVPIYFPCCSIAQYLICFWQLLHCRISSSCNTYPDVAAAGATSAILELPKIVQLLK